MATEVLAAQLLYQTIQSTLIASAVSSVGTTMTAGGVAAVGGAATSAAVTAGATVVTVAEVVVAPVAAEYGAVLLVDLGLIFGVAGAAVLGASALAGGIYYLVNKFSSNKKGTKSKVKVKHEVDVFSSESVELVVTALSDHIHKSLNKVDENSEEEDEEKEKDKKCIMTENAIDTDNNMSDDEESAPRDFQRRQKIVLTRKSRCFDGTLTGSYHLVRRLTRFLRVAGMAEFGEDLFNISKLSIFQPGLSLTKDQVCKIKDHHASHVVRLQIAPTATRVNPFYLTLRKYLGHTHCVHRVYNTRIGKEIDTLQGKMLPILLSIDWRKENPNQLSDAAANALTTMKNAWLELLEKAIKSLVYSFEQREELMKAQAFIKAMSLKFLYSKTRVGIDYMQEAQNIKKEIGKKVKQFFENKK